MLDTPLTTDDVGKRFRRRDGSVIALPAFGEGERYDVQGRHCERDTCIYDLVARLDEPAPSALPADARFQLVKAFLAARIAIGTHGMDDEIDEAMWWADHTIAALSGREE